MNLTRREKYVALTAALAIVVLLLDSYALTPVLEYRENVRTQKQVLLTDLIKASGAFQRQRVLARKWQTMLASGLKRPPEEAESAIFHALRDWSQDCRFDLSSVKPDKPKTDGDLTEIAFQVAGTGTMRSVARFLWKIETASVPLRIEQLQLGSRKDGVDDLSLQLRLSSICIHQPGGAPNRVKEGT